MNEKEKEMWFWAGMWLFCPLFGFVATGLGIAFIRWIL